MCGFVYKLTVTRSKIAHEVLDTEVTYVNALDDLMHIFVAPLQEALKRGQPILDAPDVAMFANQFAPIIGFNTRFLAALKKRVKAWRLGACIADLFAALDNKKMIETYAQYTVLCSTVLDRYTQLRQSNARFDKFVTVCYAHALSSQTTKAFSFI